MSCCALALPGGDSPTQLRPTTLASSSCELADDLRVGLPVGNQRTTVDGERSISLLGRVARPLCACTNVGNAHVNSQESLPPSLDRDRDREIDRHPP
eukprot:scaffold16078_cov61-Phaeocystis_antarctica.AAC.4